MDDTAIAELQAQTMGGTPSRARRSTAAAAAPEVVGVFADARIAVCPICPGDPPRGTDADVARLLCVSRLQQRQMNGSGVLVAIVDSGINRAHLVARGKSPTIDVARSWAPPGVPGTGGNWPVDHGTMCAYDVLIAAPRCTLLDIALLQSRRPGGSVMEGFLSDAILAYRHLLNIMSAPWRPGERRSLVVNNSWGMFHPSWDFPTDNPGNYSDNPNHPFTRIVATLERAGADILFAAGNCGRDCPDGRCEGVTTNAIYGANGSPAVLTVGGVDITGLRVGYSSTGPGRLTLRKPDLCGFTHFKGSGVYAADGGTSAATPVVAGVVAALRTARPLVPGNPLTFPRQMRDLLRTTALDRGVPGFDYDYGYGIVNGCRLSAMVTAEDSPTFEGLLRELEATAAPTLGEPVADAVPVPAAVYAASRAASPAGAAPGYARSRTGPAAGVRTRGAGDAYVASTGPALGATPAGPAAEVTASP
jgi:subtilisin family serine protease